MQFPIMPDKLGEWLTQDPKENTIRSSPNKRPIESDVLEFFEFMWGSMFLLKIPRLNKYMF